jgi:hypothetical protein
MTASLEDEPARLQALSLHASINSVLEDRLYAPGYQASFRRPFTAADVGRVMTQSGMNLSEVTPFQLDEGTLNVRVDYDNSRGTLGVKDIVLPVAKTAGSDVVGILLQRTSGDRYMFAHEASDGSNSVPYGVYTIPSAPTRRLLGLCGFSDKEFPVDSADLRVRLTQMADKSDMHTVIETVPIPIPNDPWRRVEVSRASDYGELPGTSSGQRGDLAGSGRKKHRARTPRPHTLAPYKGFRTYLGAQIEQYDPATGKLRQVETVMYSGQDGEIDMPIVTIDYDPHATDADGFSEHRSYVIPPSEDVLSIIDEALFEYLSDAELARRQG